jgi:eukaryotic-like serine/threonine-protein kinase
VDWRQDVCVQVLSHVAERLKDLHGACYVHRDVKPGNVMWLPRTKRWTLIDFGCAAQTGTRARTGFSLFYAAPEVLRAYLAKEDTIEVTEALDAWSLGILAIEMFGGKLPFEADQQMETVC